MRNDVTENKFISEELDENLDPRHKAVLKCLKDHLFEYTLPTFGAPLIGEAEAEEEIKRVKDLFRIDHFYELLLYRNIEGK